MDFLPGYKTYIGIGLTALGIILDQFGMQIPPVVTQILEGAGIVLATYGRAKADGR